MAWRRALSAQGGFTLIEVTMAAFVLVVGLLGTLVMLDEANSTTSSTKAREQGVALQREIIEAARSIPFDQLTPTSIAARVQAMPNLGDSSLTQPGWTMVRRGVTYTATVGACSVDDPSDGAGSQDPAMFCAPGASSSQCSQWLGISGSVAGTVGAVTAAAGAGVALGSCGIDLNLDGTVDDLVQADVAAHAGIAICILFICPSSTTDSNPDDYKRIVSLVSWDRGTGSRHAVQSTTVPNPGLSAAPSVTAVNTTATLPVTSGTSVPFTATTNRAPQTVAWYIDGTAAGSATGAGTTWTFTWSLGSVNATVGGSPNAGEALDGSYVIGAKAFDIYGEYGATRAKTITLNRRQPYVPKGFAGGRNGSVVEFEWAPSKERDLLGYRVYRVPSGSPSVLVCTLTVQTSCQDTNPPSASTLKYYVVAVDKDGAGALRDGDISPQITVTQTNHPPYAPSNLTATASGGNTQLTWTASPGDPDSLLQGDKVDYYRIYRDGTAFVNRYDRTADGTVTSWTDTNTGGTTHSYRVVAVDTQLAESASLGPVTR